LKNKSELEPFFRVVSASAQPGNSFIEYIIVGVFFFSVTKKDEVFLI